MKNFSLSKRLLAIANEIQQVETMLDIGTDHGYLPIYLVKSGKVKSAIAADVHEGPLARARENIEKERMTASIMPRLGDGFSVLEKGETIDAVVISGMGGALITEILERGLEALERANVHLLVLQPNVGAEKVRRWLYEHGWQLTNEQLVEEQDRIYEIITAKRGEAAAPYEENDIHTETGFLFGPLLITKRSPLFEKKWLKERKKWEEILVQLKSASESPHIRHKKAHYEKKLRLLKEVMNDETS